MTPNPMTPKKMREMLCVPMIGVPMIGVQTIVLAALLSACSGGGYLAPPPLPSTTLPSGAALKPWVAGDQGLSKPEGMALAADGRAWVTLTNLDANYAAAGPGMLAGVVPSTGATTLIDLARSDAGVPPGSDAGVDEHACVNPGAVKSDEGLLLVACGGSYGASTGPGRAVVQVNPVNGSVAHSLAAPGGFQPYSLAGGPTKIWIGDTNTASLASIERSSFALADGADSAHPAIALPCTDAADAYMYVSDLLVDGSDLFALCSAEPDGYIVQLDATTGAVKGSAQLVGATPVAMALLSDGRIAVVNSVDETLALVTRGAAGPTVQRAVYTFAHGAALQDVKARGMFVFTVSSGTNTVQKLDLSQTAQSKMLVGEVNTGDSSYPYNIVPLDDDQAIVSNNGTGVLVGVKFTGSSRDGGAN